MSRLNTLSKRAKKLSYRVAGHNIPKKSLYLIGRPNEGVPLIVFTKVFGSSRLRTFGLFLKRHVEILQCLD
ncbi:hypothetical protein KNT80_gp82 [Vibrio phage 1.245.O._10N.261.54.C7]|uniref:Uncharacterized protein n=1 Tax=Vibrio phage 1.245.O._10N.261.54.C7 TaxID=1881236 RepID=A0A2I7RWG9_9CAUD|nr:hypothetical protein KNT80_gp82 [Vibrio phage 1.245.O._10N.261.54.C7]AUR97995.1 hypothetical protein NVP1245O_82 [Vibrio phage 1.245.O._10N.261.54.C7]